MTRVPEGSGFVAFYRRYTNTWLHALATAALTAFGALSIVHRGFVAVALAAYAVPPLALYFLWPAVSGTRRLPGTGAGGDRGGVAAEPDGDESAGGGASRDHWTAVDAPTDADLLDATVVEGDAYAVGAGGVVVADGGDGWSVALPDGPTAAGATLRGIDATDDGAAVWVAGDGGTVARLDRGGGRHVDHSAPAGRTDTWEAVAVGRPGDDELVLLVNGSGELLRGRYRDGSLAWDDPVKPGDGASMSGVVLGNDAAGYCCDTNDGVFRIDDGGATFTRVGIESAAGTLTDVAVARWGPLVSSDAGVVHRRAAGTWTPDRVADEALSAVAARGERALACGGRVVYERAGADADWDRVVTPATATLASVDLGSTRSVAVGADGTIVESR